MFYKNTSYSVKTFYGVTFEPGQIKEVNGIINDKFMIIVDKPINTQPKEVQQKPSPVRKQKEIKKADEPASIDETSNEESENLK